MSQSSKLRNHKLYQIWSQVPVTYYQQGVENNLFQKLWHSHKINLAKNILNNLNFKNCLDVGCASGFMISEIAATFPKANYFGIDIYDEAIKYARKTYPSIEFKVASAAKLPFKNNYFDLILFYETIEHVENPKECLREIKRVLKKDGILILTMDSGSLLFRLVWFIWEKSKGKIWKGAHLHPFHHKALEQIIGDAGFKIRDKIFSFLGMEVTFVLSKQ
ncbi:class I SAM-dependent methyltransferase [Candidatus Daviesbacteria bacterium]|nr:class I SAM-dependent methyltransferase [Candidatus Daviesbacteria bacterium]